MPEHAHIIHHLPGRIRVHIPHLKGRPWLGRKIGEMASAIAGVHSAEANPMTGSVVVRYDRHDPQMAQRLAKALDDIGTLLSIAEPEAGKFAEAAQSLGSLAAGAPLFRPVDAALQRADRDVLRASGGLLDLAVLLPLCVAGGAWMLPGDSEGFLKSPLFLGSMVAMSVHALATHLRDAGQGAAAEREAAQ
jgi:hypothetical protein